MESLLERGVAFLLPIALARRSWRRSEFRPMMGRRETPAFLHQLVAFLAGLLALGRFQTLTLVYRDGFNWGRRLL